MTATTPGSVVKFSGTNSITFRNALQAANNFTATVTGVMNLIVSTTTTFDEAMLTTGSPQLAVNMLSDGAGSGTNTLTLSQANTFLADFINIAAGTLDLTGLGRLATGTTVFNIDVGGTLLLDNSAIQPSFNPAHPQCGYHHGQLQRRHPAGQRQYLRWRCRDCLAEYGGGKLRQRLFHDHQQ